MKKVFIVLLKTIQVTQVSTLLLNLLTKVYFPCENRNDSRFFWKFRKE